MNSILNNTLRKTVGTPTGTDTSSLLYRQLYTPQVYVVPKDSSLEEADKMLETQIRLEGGKTIAVKNRVHRSREADTTKSRLHISSIQ